MSHMEVPAIVNADHCVKALWRTYVMVYAEPCDQEQVLYCGQAITREEVLLEVIHSTKVVSIGVRTVNTVSVQRD